MAVGDNLNNNANDVGSSDVGLMDTRTDAADVDYGDVLREVYTRTNTVGDNGDKLVPVVDDANVSQTNAAEEIGGVDKLGLPIIVITDNGIPFQSVSPRNQIAAATAHTETQPAGRVETPELASRTGPELASLSEVGAASPEPLDHSREFIERAALASLNPDNMRDKLLTLADRLA